MADRVTNEEALSLLKEAPLNQLQKRAHKIRMEKNPEGHVTFVLDSNPNYTNVCNVDCTFCAFYRHKGAKDAYTKSIDQVLEHMQLAREAGLNTVLLQGGVNVELPLSYYTTLVRRCREEYPDIHPHFFSAVELWQVAQTEGLTIEQVLRALWDAGQRTIPGGGAEILSERVRLQISSKKMGPGGWIEFHHTAHKIGFRTTATMMYGHIEEPEDIIDHLDVLREAQDKIPGFTCFIPWSYKRDRTALRRTVKHWAGADAYFRILAIARIYLDNFQHIGASWFGEGKEIGMEALRYGADDFGGTIMEENVHRATEWINKTDHNGMLQMIRRAGFEPAQRDTFHRVIKTYEGIDEVYVPPAGRVKEADQLKPLGIVPQKTKRYAATSQAIVHELIDDEVIIANLDSGIYYSLRGQAAVFWELVIAHASVEEIQLYFKQHYPGFSPQNLEAFILQMIEEKLIVSSSSVSLDKSFDRPISAKMDLYSVEKFDEMRNLLMLDPIHEVDELGWPNPPRQEYAEADHR